VLLRLGCLEFCITNNQNHSLSCVSGKNNNNRKKKQKFKNMIKIIKTTALLLFFLEGAMALTTVHLKPQSFAAGSPPKISDIINGYKWLIVENNIGDYSGSLDDPPPGCDPENDVNYPENCGWPSVRFIKAHAPIYSNGDWTEWSTTKGLKFDPSKSSDKGNFMVTVMAEGHRLCGGYFAIDDKSPSELMVTMACQKHPLPLGTIRLFVFEDNAPCNGQYDPGEKGLADFGIGVNDIEGPITEDYYGNDLLSIVSGKC
jgi:hypothetical protein